MADPFSFLDNAIHQDPFANNNAFGSNQTGQNRQPQQNNYDPFPTFGAPQSTQTAAQPQKVSMASMANSNAWTQDPFAQNNAFAATGPPAQSGGRAPPQTLNNTAAANWDDDPFASDPFAAAPQQPNNTQSHTDAWNDDPFAAQNGNAFAQDPFASTSSQSNNTHQKNMYNNNNSSNNANSNAASQNAGALDLNFLFADQPQPSSSEQQTSKKTQDVNDAEEDNTTTGKKKKKKGKKKKKKKKQKQTNSEDEDEDEDEHKHYKQEIVDELYNLGVGSRAEIMAASKQTVNWKDINSVKETVEEMQRIKKRQLEQQQQDEDEDDGGDDNYSDAYGAYGGMDVKKVTEGPPTQKSLDGYTRRNQVQKTGHVMVTGSSGFRITINAAGKKKWANKFKAGDFGFSTNVGKVGSAVSKSIDNKTIRLYYHDTDPNNQPILADYGGKYKMLLYPKNPNDGDGVECKVQ